MTRTRLAAAAVAWLLLVVSAACGGDSSPELSLPAAPATRSDGTTNEDEDEASDPLEGETHYVAQALDDTLVVRTAAQEGAAELARLEAAEEVSGKVVCLVVQQVGEWVEVRLPSTTERTGWVHRDDVALSRHRFSIEVSRSDHRLTLRTGEIVVLEAPVALGPDAPPEGERLFTTALVKPPTPGGPYVAYAYSLSGAENDAQAYRDGQGVVAIHGAADPGNLGGEAPGGAIGVAPDVVTRMADAIGLPLGTPVDVVA